MKNEKVLSRRNFLGTSALLTAGSLLSVHPSLFGRNNNLSTITKANLQVLPNSKYAGVQIGAITYSFRDLEGGLEATLKACIDAGISSIELMGTGVEEYLGAPKNPVRRFPNAQNPLTEEEKKAGATYQSELKQWRKTEGSLEKYKQLRKKFNDAGIGIHIYKWTAGKSEEDLDYSFKVAKALGAVGISDELNDENARLMGPVAAKNGMYAVLHNHFQFAQQGFDVDKYLAYSPANMLNFDAGHYFGSTGLNPVDFIRKYHNRIVSIHLKDKTSASNQWKKNENQVWGQGETPLEEILHSVRDNKWPIYCDIELEYPVVPWSTSVKEVRTCMRYCRQILI